MKLFRKFSRKKKREEEPYEILVLNGSQDFRPLREHEILGLKVGDRYFERDMGAIALCEVVRTAQKDDNDCWSWEIKLLGMLEKDDTGRPIVKARLNLKSFSVGFREGCSHYFNLYRYIP